MIPYLLHLLQLLCPLQMTQTDEKIPTVFYIEGCVHLFVLW